jgi:lysyl-tRNA synthetase class 2
VPEYPSKTRRNSSIAKAKKNFEQFVQKPVRVAGRIIGITDEGFILQDESGRIEIRCKGTVNVGDIVEVRIFGEKREKNGKKYMEAVIKEFRVLSECRQDFYISQSSPNYKKAVVDLNFKEQLARRALVIARIREFFGRRNFLEVDTPQLANLPGMEPNLEVFKTKYNGRDGSGRYMYLTTSPEYAMKKLLAAGYEKIFQICKSYRNREEGSSLHNPEFTLLEWYRAYSDYTAMMKDTEELVGFVAGKIGGCRVNVSAPWDRMKVQDAFLKYAGVDGDVLTDAGRLRGAVREKGYNVDENTNYEQLFYLIFLNEIEKKLGAKKPVILYDFPAQMASLAKLCEDDPAYAQRFEVYVDGIELCNAFTELNDPEEQRKRLEREKRERAAAGREVYDIDESFIEALRFGMPPSGGNALGVDRLMMLIFGVEEIKNILYFPQA